MFKKLCYQLCIVCSLFLVVLASPVWAGDKSMQESGVEMMQKVKLNQATVEELSSIKGIGGKKAQAIIDYRSEHGDFKAVEELINVKGIGQGTLKKIQPYIEI